MIKVVLFCKTFDVTKIFEIFNNSFGRLITVEFQSAWKLVGLPDKEVQVPSKIVGLLIIVEFQSDWKLVGFPLILPQAILVIREPSQVTFWLASIVMASMLFVKILIVLSAEL